MNSRIKTNENVWESQVVSLAPSGYQIPTREKVVNDNGIQGWLNFGAGIYLTLTSTATNSSLPQTFFEKHVETASSICEIRISEKRYISFEEARRIALDALKLAEERRTAYAIKEASLITIWEETS